MSAFVIGNDLMTLCEWEWSSKSIFEKEAFSRKSPLNCLSTYRSMRGAVTQCCDAGAMSRHTRLQQPALRQSGAIWSRAEHLAVAHWHMTLTFKPTWRQNTFTPQNLLAGGRKGINMHPSLESLQNKFHSSVFSEYLNLDHISVVMPCFVMRCQLRSGSLLSLLVTSSHWPALTPPSGCDPLTFSRLRLGSHSARQWIYLSWMQSERWWHT